MYRLPQVFHNRIQKGFNPVVYVVIQTHMGRRMYSMKQLTDIFDTPAHFYDGTWLLDGSVTLGGGGDYVVSKEPRILEYDRLQKSLSTRDKNLITGHQAKRQNTFSVVLNNSDRELGKLMAREPFITRPLEVYIGYSDVDYTQHFKLYSGKVDSIELSLSSVTLTAVED